MMKSIAHIVLVMTLLAAPVPVSAAPALADENRPAAGTIWQLPLLPRLGAANGEERVAQQSGCMAVASQVASQEGGQVAGTRMVDRQGTKICVVTVLVPDPSGSRPPRRKVVEVVLR